MKLQYAIHKLELVDCKNTLIIKMKNKIKKKKENQCLFWPQRQDSFHNDVKEIKIIREVFYVI